MLTHLRINIAVACILIFAGDVASTERVDYASQIKPLLEEKCFSCHGRLKAESDLRLDASSFIREVLQPGKPDESHLFARVASTDVEERMPPEGEGTPFRPQDISLLRAWIEQGALAPDEPIPESPQEHWAYQSVPMATPPGTRTIDAILNAKLQLRGITPQPIALRSLALRRVYLDLLGMPPTLSELRDQRPWPEVVDSLLEDPRYGERWGRHWMDVWRYSDAYGLNTQIRVSQKHLWHWRDWIVESLNRDIGYDAMILQMLAADELWPNDLERIRATGFLVRNYYLFNRTTWLDATIEHTSKAFLGLTMNCAKCHDHKYDPISQEDYYRMRAVFEPHQVRLDPLRGSTDYEQDGLPRVFDEDPAIPTYLHVRGDPKQADLSRVIPPGVPTLFESQASEIETIRLPYLAYTPAARPEVQEERLVDSLSHLVDAIRSHANAQEQHRSFVPPASVVSATKSKLLVDEDFSMPNSELWQVHGDGWTYQDGQLRQTEATRDRQFVRLNMPMPRDFELKCRFTTTGGGTYRSVSFRFDESEDGADSNSVYTSAHAPGPKVQVSFSRDGKTTYPPAGKRSTDVKTDEEQSLRILVRDRLINVWWNDEFMLAYNLPSRMEGSFSLSGFDATVAFHQLQILELHPSTELVTAGETPPPTVEQLQTNVQVAQYRQQIELCKLQSLLAENRYYNAQITGNSTDPLTRQLSVSQSATRVAEARLRVASAESEVELVKAEKLLATATSEMAKSRKGERDFQLSQVAQQALKSPADKREDYASQYAAQSSGRRTAFARWIVDPRNPLTARVAVNHLWMRHFGTPLSESTFDFGLRAPKPTHLDLLDYLARELIDSGWSLKHVHRLILLSEAYQRTSSSLDASSETLSRDPNNELYWRMNSKRMESQVVRDSLLSIAGVLDRTMGGPSLDANETSRRRSLYFKHSRDDRNEFLAAFDDADQLQCYRRDESIVPQQALALANSALPNELAPKVVETLFQRESSASGDSDPKQTISKAFELLLGREATDEEKAMCSQFLAHMDQMDSSHTKNNAGEEEEPQQIATFRRRSWEALILTLLNHNDFVTVR